jgi:hypothetical protein
MIASKRHAPVRLSICSFSLGINIDCGLQLNREPEDCIVRKRQTGLMLPRHLGEAQRPMWDDYELAAIRT